MEEIIRFVMHRRDRQESNYLDDKDRQRFLAKYQVAAVFSVPSVPLWQILPRFRFPLSNFRFRLLCLCGLNVLVQPVSKLLNHGFSPPDIF